MIGMGPLLVGMSVALLMGLITRPWRWEKLAEGAEGLIFAARRACSKGSGLTAQSLSRAFLLILFRSELMKAYSLGRTFPSSRCCLMYRLSVEREMPNIWTISALG